MQNSQLKIANIVDSDKLAEIHQACFEKSWNTNDIASYMQRSGCYAVWIEDAAFVLFDIVGDECEIKTIAVLENFRRKRIAHNLCKEVVDICKEFDVKKIFLEVSEKNSAALKMYGKLGFNVFGRREDYYGPGDNAIVLSYEVLPAQAPEAF